MFLLGDLIPLSPPLPLPRPRPFLSLSLVLKPIGEIPYGELSMGGLSPHTYLTLQLYGIIPNTYLWGSSRERWAENDPQRWLNIKACAKHGAMKQMTTVTNSQQFYYFTLAKPRPNSTQNSLQLHSFISPGHLLMIWSV